MFGAGISSKAHDVIICIEMTQLMALKIFMAENLRMFWFLVGLDFIALGYSSIKAFSENVKYH